jgi:non-heme chloroperoxidase
MSFIKTQDGTNLFYNVCGKGRPLVFTHGWCINSDSWEYMINGLVEKGYQCIVYDLRGCGRSDQPWEGYDYGTLARDLSDLIEYLDLKDIILVSHSLGCGVATRYLSEYGEARVHKAVYISTCTPFIIKSDTNPDGIDQMFLLAGLQAIKKDRPAFVRGLVDAYMGITHIGNVVSDELVDWGTAITLQASSRASSELLITNFVTDQREELKKIKIPVLMLHGDKDINAFPQLTALPTHDLLTNSELKFIEGHAHGVYMLAFDELNQHILDFINR